MTSLGGQSEAAAARLPGSPVGFQAPPPVGGTAPVSDILTAGSSSVRLEGRMPDRILGGCEESLNCMSHS